MVSVEENDLLFALKTCRRSGSTISCAGSITNKGNYGRTVTLGVDWDFVGVHSDAVDDLGNQYKVSLKRQDYNLESNLPINFSFGIDGVAPGASRINIRPRLLTSARQRERECSTPECTDPVVA